MTTLVASPTDGRAAAGRPGDPMAEIMRIVESIRSDAWVDPRLRGHLGVRDTTLLESGVLGMLDALGRVHPQVAAMLRPLRDLIGKLVPDSLTGLVAGSLGRLADRTRRAEQDLGRVQGLLRQRWRSGAAAEAVQARAGDLRMRMSAGSAAAGGLSTAVDRGGLVVAAARVVALGVIKVAAGAALQWIRQYGVGLLQRGAEGLAHIVQHVGGLIRQAVQQVRGIVQALLDSQGRLAALVRKLGQLLTSVGPGGGGPPGGSGGGLPPESDEERRKREDELGWDPAVGKARPMERETALRVQDRLDVRLRRADIPNVDWVDTDGRTYDAVGNFPAKHFERQWPNLQERIRDHLDKADYVPVDVAQWTPEQVQRVREFVRQFQPRAFIVGD